MWGGGGVGGLRKLTAEQYPEMEFSTSEVVEKEVTLQDKLAPNHYLIFLREDRFWGDLYKEVTGT